jgi:AcrR family transcriptional regulator
MTASPIFGVAKELPRGPHRLSREEVRESQRARLLTACVDVIAERGFATATTAAIARQAGVSPRTFYDHFEDKLAGLLVAYDLFSQQLFTRLVAALQADDDVDGIMDRTVTVYLSTWQQNPQAAKAFLIEMESAGPVARRRRRDANVVFAAGVRAIHERVRESDPSLGELSFAVFRAVVHGVRELTRDALETGSPDALPSIKPELISWLRLVLRGLPPTPYEPPAAARQADSGPAPDADD